MRAATREKPRSEELTTLAMLGARTRRAVAAAASGGRPCREGKPGARMGDGGCNYRE